jgi:apolipoprotein N-acyltransferase
MNLPEATPGGPWQRMALGVAGLKGWRRAALATVAGALTAAALPPIHAVPVLLVSFPVLVWLIDGSGSHRAALAAGWWFGFGSFLAGLYWVGFSFQVDAAKFGSYAAIAVIALAAGLAIFPAIAALATRAAGIGGAGRIPVLAAAWTACEWLRGTVLTGFPWNSLGTVWAFSDAMIQLAALAGVFGLTLVTVLAGAAPATLGDGGNTHRCWVMPAAAAALLAVVWAGGAWRLAGAAVGSEGGSVAGVALRLVQANIPQVDKWRPEMRDRIFRKYLRLSRAGNVTATHVIWPETATPFFVANDAVRRRVMTAAVPPGGLLLTGSIRTTRRGTRPFRVWNSFHAVDGAAKLIATYDKFHLVPFGEYIPLPGFLRVSKLTVGRTDFSAGPGPRTLTLPGLPPVSPLICYEAIFPGQVTEPGNRPRWLLNLTNDAWFGNSSGPYQHFAATRFRAVEEGLPLVRSANTGISAVVDAYGRVTARLGLGVEGVIDSPLPAALAAPTPYARFGNPVLLVLMFITAIAGWFMRLRN